MKEEKITQMMAEVDPSGLMADKEKPMRDTLSKLAYMNGETGIPSAPEDIPKQHRSLQS
ncbi:hypothetical protein HK102_013050 [Quaeritorhiza haematococci]|nr:hypothetical protein HK102_013050 [Quaeritorhiza haematococci]